MSNSIDPDNHYEPSHLDPRYLQKPIIITCGSESVKGLSNSIVQQMAFLFIFFFVLFSVLHAKCLPSR